MLSGSTKQEAQQALHTCPGTKPKSRQPWLLPCTGTRLSPSSSTALQPQFPLHTQLRAGDQASAAPKAKEISSHNQQPLPKPCPTTAASAGPTSTPRGKATILLTAPNSPHQQLLRSYPCWEKRGLLSSGNWWQLMAPFPAEDTD